MNDDNKLQSVQSAQADCVRIGMLTPSSNTVLEPYTSSMFDALNGRATVHYSRFRVTEISLSQNSQGQFSEAPILEAAERLAEAKVDCIAWNGTSASWLGLDHDRKLCDRITRETGIASTSTILGFFDALRFTGAKRLSLITPYLSEIQQKIIKNFSSHDLEIVHETHLEDPGNYSFAEYSTEHIHQLTLDAATHNPDAILIVCTNFRGAPVAQSVEETTGVTVLDSVSVTAWQTLRMSGIDPSQIKGWGSVFDCHNQRAGN